MDSTYSSNNKQSHRFSQPQGIDFAVQVCLDTRGWSVIDRASLETYEDAKIKLDNLRDLSSCRIVRVSRYLVENDSYVPVEVMRVSIPKRP